MAMPTPAALDIPGFIASPAMPAFQNGNIGQVSTLAKAADNTFVTLEPYTCTQVNIINMSGVPIQYARAIDKFTNFVTINTGFTQVVQGIQNASQLGIRRGDFNGTQAPITVSYEALY